MNSNPRPAVTVSGPARSRPSRKIRLRLEQLEGREVPAVGLSATANWVSEGPTNITGGQVVASSTRTTATAAGVVTAGTTTQGSVSGAIDAVYASRSTPDLMFAGGPNGGVWRTTNGTAATPTWTPISDTLSSLSVTDISIDPSDNSRVLVGIGGSADGGYRYQTYRDANGNVRPIDPNNVIRGDLIGPLFTTNALAANPTWRVLSQLAGQEIQKVYVRSNLLLVATNTGVYQSTDDGLSFSLAGTAPGSQSTAGRVFDLAEDPGNPNRFYAAVKPAGTNTTPRVLRTDDGGFNWGDVSDTTQFPGTFTPGQMKLNANTVNVKISVYNQNNVNGDVVYVAVVNDVPPPLDTQITNLNQINTLPFPNNAQGRGAQLASVVWSTNQGGNWTRMDIPRYLGGLQFVGGAGSSINNGVVTMTSRHRLQTGDQIYMRNADNNINPDPAAPDTTPPINFFGNNNAIDPGTGALVTPELWYVRVVSETVFEIGAVPPLLRDGTPNPAFAPFATGTASPTTNPPGFSGIFQLAQGINMGERGEFLDLVADPNNVNLVYLAGSSPYAGFENEVGGRTFTANVWRGNRDTTPTGAPANVGNFYTSNQWIPIAGNPGPAVVGVNTYPPPNILPPTFNPTIDTRNPGGGFNWTGRPTSPESEPTLNPNRGGNPTWSNPGTTPFVRPNQTADGSAPPADPREITFDANGQLVLATGGGLYRQTAPTGNTGGWVNINGNLDVTQVWSAAYDAISNRVILGTQDTSGVAQTATGGSTYKSALTLAQMGNTFDQSNVYTVQVDNVSRAALNQSVRYYIGGNFSTIIRQVVDATGTVVANAPLTFGGPATPGIVQSGLAGTDPAGNWLGENQPGIAMILNSQDPRRALYGTTELYEDSDPIGDSGNVVNRVTPVTKSATSRFTAVAYGGRRANTPFNQIAFAGTTEGELFRRGEFGVTFSNLNVPGGTAVIDDIAVDADDWRHVFVVKGGRVYETTNADAASPTWTDVSANLVGPATADGTPGPGFQTTKIYTIALWDPNPGSTNGGVVLVAGGRGGVFRLSVDPRCQRTNWTEYGTGMPNSVVTDLNFVGNRLTAATFGRGVYSIADVSSTLAAPVTLLVTGDGGNNVMTVTATPGNANAVTVTDGLGNTGTFLLSQFDKIQVDGLGGADFIVVGSNGLAATSTLDFAQFPIEVNAGGQVNDVLVLQATGLVGGRQATVTGTSVGGTLGDNLFGPCGYLLYTGLNQGTLFLRTGSGPIGGNDVFVMAPEVMPLNFDLNGGTGSDTYQFSTNTSGTVTITDAVASDTVVVNGTVAVENFFTTSTGVSVNTLRVNYGTGVRSLQLTGGLALDTLTSAATAGTDALVFRQTAAGAFTLTGLAVPVTASAIEAVTVNGVGGADTLAYEDRTGGTYGTVGNPSAGLVYRPTGNTSGRLTAANGTASDLSFVNIAGSVSVNGDPTGTGGRDVLTVLGFTTTGLTPSFGEATVVNGKDLITASDTQVSITNVAFGEIRPINIALGANGKSSYSNVFVRTGNEAKDSGDVVTASPSLRTNLVIDGGDPTAGPNEVVTPGDTITVNVNGRASTSASTDPTLGPAQTRVSQQVNQASLGHLNFETASTKDVGGGPNPNPVPTSNQIFVVGTEAGVPGQMIVYDAKTGAVKYGPIAPFPGFRGGLRVATGEFNGDGVVDFAVAAGPGGGPAAVVYDGATGAELTRFFPFEAGFRGGVTLALGDVNGDGFDDLIFGAGPGGGPRVKVVGGQDRNTLQDFFAYDPGFRGGVNVGAGDLTGDGRADIITGARPGGGPHVQAFDGQDLRLLNSFFAFDPGFRGGVNVSAGDVTGDGVADFVVGAGSGGGAHVKVFNGRGSGEIRSFFVTDPNTGGAPPIVLSSGVNVAAIDQDGDGLAEVLTGRGAGARPFAQIFRVSQFSGGVVVPTLLSTLAVNTFGDSYSGGITVG